MDAKLINAIVRVCQSEFVRHYPNDVLLGHLEANQIGRWSGDTYQISPADKKVLADQLLHATGVDAFSPEVGGTFMMGKVAHLSSHQEIVEVAEPRVVMVKGLNNGHVQVGPFDARLPPGASMCIPFETPPQTASHQAIILCQHYALYDQIQQSCLNFEDIGFNPLVVFNGATPSQRDSAMRFLQSQRIPVHCAFDLSPEGLRLALDVPFFGSFLLPAADIQEKLIGGHNKTDAYLSQAARLRNDFHDATGQIKLLWERVTTHELCISSKAYVFQANEPEESAPKTASQIDISKLSEVMNQQPTAPHSTQTKQKKPERTVNPADLANFKSVVDEKTLPIIQEKARYRAKDDDSEVEIESFSQYKLD